MRGRAALAVVGLLVPAVVLAPLVGRGVALSYDMVFVPRQTLRPADFGLGTALPRAVPADALVSLASTVLPGSALQQLVLALTLGLAAVGAGLVLPADRPLARCVAAVAYAWNPYVAERLGQGHWSLLVGYAALPYVLRAGADARAGVPRAWPRLVLATAVAAITPTGGLLAAALGLAVTRRARAAAVALTVNLPWLVPGLLHPGGGGSDPAGVAAFAARPENWSGLPGALLGLGGIWNADVVPASRTTAVAPLLTLLALGLAAAGAARLRDRPGIAPLAAVAGVGLGLAAAGPYLLAGPVRALAGAGLLRDGQKLLGPLALLLALAAGLGAERLVRGRRLGPAVAALALALPVVTTPELAWGAGLRAVHYSADWAAVDRRLRADDHPGDVVALPYQAFRAYGWTPRTVLDPAPRYFDRTVVTSDTLVVGGVGTVRGEDRRAERVGAALAAGEPLGPLGIGWVLVEHGQPGEPPAPPGTLVYAGPDLSLYRVPDVTAAPADRPPLAPVVGADVLAALLVLGAAGTMIVRRPLPAGRV